MKTIVHQQVNHNNGICTKTAVCIQACDAQTKSMTPFFILFFDVLWPGADPEINWRHRCLATVAMNRFA